MSALPPPPSPLLLLAKNKEGATVLQIKHNKSSVINIFEIRQWESVLDEESGAKSGTANRRVRGLSSAIAAHAHKRSPSGARRRATAAPTNACLRAPPSSGTRRVCTVTTVERRLVCLRLSRAARAFRRARIDVIGYAVIRRRQTAFLRRASPPSPCLFFPRPYNLSSLASWNKREELAPFTNAIALTVSCRKRKKKKQKTVSAPTAFWRHIIPNRKHAGPP